MVSWVLSLLHFDNATYRLMEQSLGEAHFYAGGVVVDDSLKGTRILLHVPEPFCLHGTIRWCKETSHLPLTNVKGLRRS